MKPSDYSQEKLYFAVRSMVIGTGDLPSRIRDAWTDHLHLAFNQANWPSPESWAEYRSIAKEIESAGLDVASTANVPGGDPKAIAERIFSLYITVVRENEIPIN